MRVTHDSDVWALPEDGDDLIDLEELGPVWYLVMRGHREDGSHGPIGVVWVAESGGVGGYVGAARAGWLGAEMRRSYDGARRRGWDAGRIFRYWSDEPGELTGLDLDPAARAADLATVRRLATTE